VALSAERMKAWMSADLSQLDLLAIQIDGMHISNELTLLTAIGIDGSGAKHPLGLLEGATETPPWCRRCWTNEAIYCARGEMENRIKMLWGGAARR
jgi:putative transposase